MATEAQQNHYGTYVIHGIGIAFGVIRITSLISQPKHMLWVLKRTVSMRRFF